MIFSQTEQSEYTSWNKLIQKTKHSHRGLAISSLSNLQKRKHNLAFMKCHVWGRHIETREYIGSYKASTKKRIKEMLRPSNFLMFYNWDLEAES